MKRCSKCQRQVSLETYERTGGWCETCTVYYLNYWKGSTGRLRKAPSKEEIRSTVIAKYGGCCNCCGETHERFLTLDHVNNDGHLERRKGNYVNYKTIYFNGVNERFQVLCWNCNMGKAVNKGVCPHKTACITIDTEGGK